MKKLILISIVILITSCQTKMIFTISKHLITNKIPSGSGIIYSQNKYYIIGDDSPFLYVLNHDFKILEQIKLINTETNENNRINKSNKPDFEAFEKINDTEFVIFGSGSKSPKRDIFIRVLLENNEINKIENYVISKFYNHLKQLPEFKNIELNIEAACYHKNTLYLFNRQKNIIISINYNQFLDCIINNSKIPEIELNFYNLPKINNLEAGFSGAIAFVNEEKLLITASVENTNNAYDDGEILGSFLGILPIINGKISSEINFCAIPNLEKLIKVESIAIKEEISTQKTKLVLVTDDDLGNSIIIEGVLNR